MPVKAVGKNIVEKRTGKVVGHSKSAAMAKKAARVRNWKHAVKQGKAKDKPMRNKKKH